MLIRLSYACWLAGIITVVSCSTNKEEVPQGTIVETEKQKFQVDTITSQLKNPWGIAFYPMAGSLSPNATGKFVS
jgi:hypothetical protein